MSGGAGGDDGASESDPSGSGTQPVLYLPQLDGLRCLAFLMVFVHHLPVPDGPLLNFLHAHGWCGVSLFLTLSAYLLTRILKSEYDLRGRIDLRRYLIRRTLRIWPLYFAFVLAAFVLHVSKRPASLELAGRLVGLLTFSDNLLTALHGYNPIRHAAHLWTISLEEQFYLVLPALLSWALVRGRSLAGLALWLWLAFLGLRTISIAAGMAHPFVWTLPISADVILAGIALNDERVARFLARFPASACLVGGMGLMCGLRFVPPLSRSGIHLLWLFPLTAASAALLCHAALHYPPLRLLGARPLRYLGKISYGLYVFHLAGISVGAYAASVLGGAYWTHALLSLALTVALSVCSYELLEKPFLRFKGRFEVIRTRPT